MNLTPEHLERLDRIIGVISEGTVKPEEFVSTIDALIDQMNEARKDLQKAVDNLDTRTRSDLDRVIGQLRQQDGNGRAALSQSVRTLSEQFVSELATLRSQMEGQLARVELMIPELPPEFDASDLHEALKGHQEALDGLSVLITGENIRNALEVLPEGEKLSLDAIEGLVAILDELRSKSGGKGFAGVHLLRYLSDVNIEGITNGQTIAWNSTLQRFEPSPSSGAGITVETPSGTVNASNATFTVTAAPKWIVSDGITYFQGAGYSRSGLTVTMDVPPSQFIRAII